MSEADGVAEQNGVDVGAGVHAAPDHGITMDLGEHEVVARGAGSGQVVPHAEGGGGSGRQEVTGDVCLHVHLSDLELTVPDRLGGAVDREVEQLDVARAPIGARSIAPGMDDRSAFPRHVRALGVHDAQVEAEHLLTVRVDGLESDRARSAGGHHDLVRHPHHVAVPVGDLELAGVDAVAVLVEAVEGRVHGTRVGGGVAVVAVRGAGVPVAVQVHVGHEAGVVGGEVRVGGEEGEDLGEGHGMSSVRRSPV